MNRKIIGIIKLFGNTRKIAKFEILFTISYKHNFFKKEIVITFRNCISYYFGDGHQICVLGDDYYIIKV